MANQSVFPGIYVASLIPLNRDLNCNDSELAAHCQDLIHKGCRGIVLFGSTGEGPSFSVEERRQILASLIERGLDSRKLIMGVGCSALPDAVALVRAAVEQNCLGVLVMPPFYYKNISDEGVIHFYRTLIEQTGKRDFKLILYHIPQYTGVPLNLNIIRVLRAEFPETVIGIKESEGNLTFTQAILKEFPGFQVFVGGERLILEAVKLGAAGGIVGLANAYPELICSLYEHGLDQQKPNRMPEMMHIHEILKNYPIFPAIKSIVEHQKGSQWHLMRPPLVPLNKKQSQTLMEALAT